MTSIDKLIQAWLGDNGVQRVTHDDDALSDHNRRSKARMRPQTDLTKASAEVLQGAGFLMPVGDGSYLVTWMESSHGR